MAGQDPKGPKERPTVRERDTGDLLNYQHQDGLLEPTCEASGPVRMLDQQRQRAGPGDPGVTNTATAWPVVPRGPLA